jgi:hypothetical protein
VPPLCRYRNLLRGRHMDRRMALQRQCAQLQAARLSVRTVLGRAVDSVSQRRSGNEGPLNGSLARGTGKRFRTLSPTTSQASIPKCAFQHPDHGTRLAPAARAPRIAGARYSTSMDVALPAAEVEHAAEAVELGFVDRAGNLKRRRARNDEDRLDGGKDNCSGSWAEEREAALRAWSGAGCPGTRAPSEQHAGDTGAMTWSAADPG